MNQNVSEEVGLCTQLTRPFVNLVRNYPTNAPFCPITVSTISKVADFGAQESIRTFSPEYSPSLLCLAVLPDNSMRISQAGELFFPPYTALGWDQNIPSLESLAADETARLEDVICFGRPL